MWDTPADILALTDGQVLAWWLNTKHDPWFRAVPADEEWGDVPPHRPGSWTVIDAENAGVIWNLNQTEAEAWAGRLNKATGKP